MVAQVESVGVVAESLDEGGPALEEVKLRFRWIYDVH